MKEPRMAVEVKDAVEWNAPIFARKCQTMLTATGAMLAEYRSICKSTDKLTAGLLFFFFWPKGHIRSDGFHLK
jgi:hypothetical protein